MEGRSYLELQEEESTGSVKSGISNQQMHLQIKLRGADLNTFQSSPEASEHDIISIVIIFRIVP